MKLQITVDSSQFNHNCFLLQLLEHSESNRSKADHHHESYGGAEYEYFEAPVMIWSYLATKQQL